MSKDIIGQTYTNFDTMDIANVLVGITKKQHTILDEDDCIDEDILVSEVEEALYILQCRADSEYMARYRVLWNVLQAVAEATTNEERRESC